MPKFNNVELSVDTMQQTRQHFADNSMACINEVLSGSVKVNDKEEYFAWMRSNARCALSGKLDHTFTFLQRAYWLQTGEMVALLT
jgi:hypothetical protein